jgi:cyclic pyranopterin phosphate synthase
MNTLRDSFGRRFTYLRLSIIDACNFSCTYCLPGGYKKASGEAPYLSPFEIQNLITAFAEMGTVKVRLTGGEPTLRNDFLEIARMIQNISGIEKIALSTNAYRLKELAPDLKSAGISSLNISIDSLDPEVFYKITKTHQLEHIINGIRTALESGFDEIKINAVLMKNLTDHSYLSFLDWVKTEPVVVRFIELMPTLENKKLFQEHHMSANNLRDDLLLRGWQSKIRGLSDGPAEEFTHKDYRGRMGLIAPYAQDFCSNCNRLRVTSRGDLRLCLFGEGNHSLRDLLQSPDQKEELQMRLVSFLQKKEISHYLPEGKYGNNFSFSSMGG